MNRKFARQTQAGTKKVVETLDKRDTVQEAMMTGKVCPEFMQPDSYGPEQIWRVGQLLLKSLTHKKIHEQALIVASSEEELMDRFGSFEKGSARNLLTQPLAAIVKLPSDSAKPCDWVTFCVTQLDQKCKKIIILFKDPGLDSQSGAKVPEAIQRAVKTFFHSLKGSIHNDNGMDVDPDLEFRTHRHQHYSDREHFLISSSKSAVMSLRNLEVMLQNILPVSSQLEEIRDWGARDRFIRKFEDFKGFCKPDDSELKKVVLNFYELVIKEKSAELAAIVEELFISLCQNEQELAEFKRELNVFIRICLKLKGHFSLFQDYREALKRETQRLSQHGTDPNDSALKTLPAVSEPLDSIRQKFLHPTFFADVENYLTLAKSATELNNEATGAREEKHGEKSEGWNPQNSFILNIQQTFPKQMQSFQSFFSHLALVKLDEDGQKGIRKILELVSLELGLSADDLMQFFELQNVRGMDKEPSQADLNSIKIEDVMRELPPLNKKSNSLHPNPIDASINDIDRILEDIELNQPDASKTCTRYKEDYRRVQEIYETTWQTKGALEIRQWAQTITQRTATSLQLDILEALAVMDRANEVVTGGHRLRIPQIISILVFLDQSPYGTKEDSSGIFRGKLCQIQAGEGKTTVVAILAAIKLLQGVFTTVDVITSNAVLAQEGVEESRLIFDLLDISVTTNTKIKKDCSKSGDEFEEEPEGARRCYSKHVVYGSIGTFQFDYLREVRSGRIFGCLILDEVDSMLIDSGAHIAKIAHSLPGFESLKYFYFKIWERLSLAEGEMIHELKDRMKKKSVELEEMKNNTDEVKQESFEQFQAQLMSTVEDELRMKILREKDGLLESNRLLPSHLKAFAVSSFGRWVDNAIKAKFSMHENHHYSLQRVKVEGMQDKWEHVIVPIDYANTGVTMTNTVWSHGLHQFVQLKHELRLTSESLTTCCISNYGYMRLYPLIFGMTGTLGSVPEQQLLAQMYNVGFSRIPPYKKRRFAEYEGIISPDSNWLDRVSHEALTQVKNHGRAVLIVSQTIADSLSVQQCIEHTLDFLQKNSQFQTLYYGKSAECDPRQYDSELPVKIRTFLNEDGSSILREPVVPGDVIIATNIAGRGANFRTHDDLEKNGGLHVLLTFYPDNDRVRHQAFYRTSRQGRNGSARIILRQRDTRDLIPDSTEAVTMAQVSGIKDQLEKRRVDHLRTHRIAQLYYQDTLYHRFREHLSKHTGKARHTSNMKSFYAKKDLSEFWAFWIESRNWSNPPELDPDLTTSDPSWQTALEKKASADFQLFLNLGKTKQILETNSIVHNPYYSIHLGEAQLRAENLTEAENTLKNAITRDHSPGLLYAAHSKLFEISIHNGGVLLEKFKDTLAKVAVFGHFYNVKDEGYKTAALYHLAQAVEALNTEIEFLQNWTSPTKTNSGFKIDDSKLESLQVRLEVKSTMETAENGSHKTNEDPCLNSPPTDALRRIKNDVCEIGKDEKDTDQVESIFLRHLRSRLLSLQVHKGNLEGLRNTIENSSSAGLTISSRITDYFQKLEPKTQDEEELKAGVYPTEIADLVDIGLNTMYGLNEVHDAPKEVIASAQGYILSGLATLAVGCVFPPAAVATGPIAAALITEGMIDIAVELINYKRDSAFDLNSYLKEKSISAAVSICTLGLSAIVASFKIFQKAIQACRSLADALRFGGVLVPGIKKLFVVTANGMDKMANLLQAMVSMAKKSLAAGKTMNVMYEVTKGVTTGVAGYVAMEHVIAGPIDRMLVKTRARIQRDSEEVICSFPAWKYPMDGLRVRLSQVPRAEIFALVKETMTESTLTQVIAHIAGQVTTRMIKQGSHWAFKVGGLALDAILSSASMNAHEYCNSFCKKFSSKLANFSSCSKAELKNEEHIQKLLRDIAGIVTDAIYGAIKRMAGGVVNTLVVSPLLSKSFATVSKVMSSRVKSRELARKDEKSRPDEDSGDFEQAMRAALKTLNLEEGATPNDIRQACRIHFLDLALDRPENLERNQGCGNGVARVKIARDLLLGRMNAAEFQHEMQAYRLHPDAVNSHDVNGATSDTYQNGTPLNVGALTHTNNGNHDPGKFSNFVSLNGAGQSDAHSGHLVVQAGARYAGNEEGKVLIRSHPVPSEGSGYDILRSLDDPTKKFNCAQINIAHGLFGVAEDKLVMASGLVNRGFGASFSDVYGMINWTGHKLVVTNVSMTSDQFNERILRDLMIRENTSRAIICVPGSSNRSQKKEMTIGHIMIANLSPSGTLSVSDFTKDPEDRSRDYPRALSFRDWMNSSVVSSGQGEPLRLITARDLTESKVMEFRGNMNQLRLAEVSSSSITFTNESSETGDAFGARSQEIAGARMVKPLKYHIQRTRSDGNLTSIMNWEPQDMQGRPVRLETWECPDHGSTYKYVQSDWAIVDGGITRKRTEYLRALVHPRRGEVGPRPPIPEAVYENLQTGQGRWHSTRMDMKLDAGHIIADRLGGPIDASWNYFPQIRNFNRGEWSNKVEANIAKIIEERGSADIEFRFNYDNPNTNIPRGFFFRIYDTNQIQTVDNGYYCNMNPTPEGWSNEIETEAKNIILNPR